MKISTLVKHLNLIKEAHGDLSVWIEADYFAYDDNASKSGPVIDEPLVQYKKEIPVIVLWAFAD